MGSYGSGAGVDETIAATGGEDVAADSRPDDVRALEPGSLVGRYVVSRRIGMGSMGVVYAAHDPELGRDIALKLVKVDHRPGRTDATARVMREAQAIARLNHPNVIVVNDVGQHDDQVFIAMELVNGMTLSSWLSSEPRSWRAVLETVSKAGEGLAAAHAAGLVHRDFKPDNVLVGDDGRARVLDFGLARPASGHSLHGTMPVSADGPVAESSDVAGSVATRVSGTPAYMAPEQFKLKPAEAKADQFSFCVTLWEALFGQRPFEGDSYATIGAAVTLGRRRDPPAGTDVPRWLQQAINRGLAVEPNERWPSVDDLLERLRAGTRGGRTRALWLGGGAAMCAVGAWLAFAGGDEDATCSGGSERLDDAWGPQTRAAVTQSFESSALPFASDVWRKLEGELDGYANAWTEAHHEACAATQVRHERSQALMTAQMDCLAQRRRALESLTRALADTPSASAIGRALEAVRGLPAVSSCTDLEYVTAAVAPPADPAVEAKVDDVRTQISRAKSAAALGDARGALAEMRQALADADLVEYEPVRLEAALALGQLEDQAGNYDEAEAQLRRAFFGATQAGANEVAAEAATQLVRIVGDRLGRLDEAMQWVRHAEAALGASGGDRMRLWRALAGVHHRAGDLDSAESYYTKALQRAEESGVQLQIAATCDDIGVLYSDRANYPKARALHKRALEIRETEHGPNHPAIAASLLGLANVDQFSGQFDDAVTGYKRAKTIFVAAHGPEAAALAGLHHNLGRLQFMRGDLGAALHNFERSAAVMEEHRGPDHPMVAAVLNSLGVTLRRLDRVDEALEVVQRAEAIQSRALGPDHVDRASTLVSLANIYDLQGRLEEALALHEESERIFRKGLGEEHPQVLVALINQALLHSKLEKPTRAVTLLKQALEIQTATVDSDPPYLALTLRSLGQALNADNRPRDAIAPLRRALKIQELKQLEGESRGETEMILARALWATGERGEAVALADSACDRFVAEEASAELESANAWRKSNGLPPK